MTAALDRGLVRKGKFVAEARNELLAMDGDDANAVLRLVAKMAAGFPSGSLLLNIALGSLTGEIFETTVAKAKVRYVLKTRTLLVLQVVAKERKELRGGEGLALELVKRHLREHQVGSESFEDVRSMVVSRAEPAKAADA